jgi:hypothetical protein
VERHDDGMSAPDTGVCARAFSVRRARYYWSRSNVIGWRGPLEDHLDIGKTKATNFSALRDSGSVVGDKTTSPSLAQMKPRGPSKCRPLCRFHDTCAELNEIFLNH